MIGGPLLRGLLMLNLHARTLVTLTEVCQLVQWGFGDGAQARSRTVHEYVVISMILSSDTSNIISERYQDRAIFEAVKELKLFEQLRAKGVWRPETEIYDERSRAALEARAIRARKCWGDEITQEYGWARPALSEAVASRKRILFTDLEQAVGMDIARFQYIQGNHMIHAGPMAAIRAADFKSQNPHPTHARIEDHRLANIGQYATTFLEWSTRATVKGFGTMLDEWDDMLWLVPLFERTSRTRNLFSSPVGDPAP